MSAVGPGRLGTRALPAAANDGDEAPAYAELHCLSDFSFQRGASSAQELFTRAAALGYRALAITDECSLAGIVRAWEASRATGVKLIVGSELRLHDGPTLVLLVEDTDGYAELCRLITLGRGRSAKGGYRLQRTDLEHLGSGLQVLWPPGPLAHSDAATLAEHGAWVAAQFAGRVHLAVELHRGPDDTAELQALQRLGARFDLPLAAAGDVHMHARGRRALQDVLTAIRLGVPVGEAGTALFPNGEHHLRPRPALAVLYPPTLLRATCAVAARCRFDLEGIDYVYPHELVPDGQTPTGHLRALTEAGARRRWPDGTPAKVRTLIEKELALIQTKRYEAFFLTVEDIVRFARSKDILCQGRGSAANSAVCFCLGITAVPPDRFELLFERFISEQRDEPPDIDVDFEHERREEVIQYVFEKYGRDRAALAATVICYRGRSAARDVGRALGLDNDRLDQLSHAYSHAHGAVDIDERLRERGFDPAAPLMQRLKVLVGQLRGMPRHLSQHVGGFVISEHPLHRLVPVENAAMAGRTVIQWDKDDLESLGLLKVDCLALGMLTCLRKCLHLLKQHEGMELELATIPQEDPATYDMICAADTVGTFQIESRAQMSMLPRLRPRTYYDLVVQVAIVRPGPIQGGMVHPYLKRRSGEEPVTYPSDAVRGVLGRTLGVPIFQEQVMKLLEVAAGFSASEADHVRRSMAAWKRHGGLEHFEQRIHEGLAANGYDADFADRIYQQILGFGSYGFPESHAASFALLAYASCWLKRHHPAAFACALLNAQPMGFYGPSQIIQDVRRHGVEVRAVDVDHSHWDCTLERRRDGSLALRMGLRLVAGLSDALAGRIGAARAQAAFTDIGDLCRRADVDARQCRLLARAGALRRLSGHRHRAYWDGAGVEQRRPLLDAAEGREQRIALRPPSLAEDVLADYAATGLSLQRHPLGLVRAALMRRRVHRASDIARLPHGVPLRHAGLVTVRQRPGTASGVTFVTLEDETGQVNVVVWRQLAERQRRVLLESVLLGVDGELQESEGVRHLIARRLHDWSDLLPALDGQSRDFH